MRVFVCPHCGSSRIITSQIPKEFLYVLACPACRGYVVLFRNKVTGLDRVIFDRGSLEERRAHVATIVAEVLGIKDVSGISPKTVDELESAFTEVFARLSKEESRSVRSEEAISQAEFDHFVKFDLPCIDDAVYFEKHFH